MRDPRGFLTLLCAALVLAVPTAAQQPAASDSHERLPGRIDRAAAERRLAERFQIAASKSPLDHLEKLLRNPESFGLSKERLREMARDIAQRPQDFGVDLNDPKFQEMAKRIAEDVKKMTPEQIESLKQLFPDLKVPPKPMPPDRVPPRDAPPKDMGKPTDGNPPKDNVNKDSATKPPTVTPPTPPTPPQPPVIRRDPPTSRQRPQSDSWIGRQLSGVGGSGIATGLRDRLRGLLGPGTGIGNLTRGLSRETRRFTSNIMPRISGPRLDGLFRRLGNLGPRNINVSAPRISAPSISRISLGSGEGIGTMLLLFFGLGALGVLLYALARRKGWVSTAKDGWRLGPWPVDPKGVSTREDVVKAFEYLALLLLGRKAGSANHIDIASQIASSGDNTRSKGEAARELARVYEHARYAPPQEPLSERETESARRDLDLLAGVPAA
jgi:hypothetical protein